jgi:colanic acid/amylovoran biosynthesis glycosyltransferase
MSIAIGGDRVNRTFGETRRVLHVVGSALSRSETFIGRQLEGASYEPSLLAWSRVADGLSIPCPTTIIDSGRAHWLGRHLRWAARVQRHLDTTTAVWRSRADVVHAHFGTAGARIRPHCQLLRKPLIVSFYGFDVGQVGHDARARRAFARLCRSVSAITAEGPVLARRLIALGAHADSVKLLPLTLPSWALAAPERVVAFHDDGLRLVQVARFVEKKGVDTTLRALALARRQGVDASLDLVGEGPLRDNLESLARELGLGAAVRWHGFIDSGSLPSILARAHALVQPSRTGSNGDTEGGHPTVIIEAQAAGIPALATRHADIPSVVADGQTGILVDENAPPEALAASIVWAHEHRERLAAMGASARAYVLRRHHPERLIHLRERIYREARRAFELRRAPAVRAA